MLEVIIVDDDQIVVFIQQKMICNHAITSNPISFSEAGAALDYLNEQHHRAEKKEFLIFLDINMPKMNGWEFLDSLNKYEDNSNCHVVMVSSSINRRDREKAIRYHMVRAFIEKPITASDCEKIKDISEISHFFQPV